MSPGNTLLLDDGHIQLRVESVEGSRAADDRRRRRQCSASTRGSTRLAWCCRRSALTPKDADDLAFGVAGAASTSSRSASCRAPRICVQAREALVEARHAADPARRQARAARGRSRASTRSCDACDAVMVARGDLGLELPLERVPRVQKEVTRRARALRHSGHRRDAGARVDAHRAAADPRRSQRRANAVDDGVDAIMLAGETAAGKLIRSARCRRSTSSSATRSQMPPVRRSHSRRRICCPGHGRALCEAAVTLAEHSDAAAIVAVTRGGKTARVLSALRPRAPILRGDRSAPMSRGGSRLSGVSCRSARSRRRCETRRLRASARTLVEQRVRAPAR